jgi:hypothetical protein
MILSYWVDRTSSQSRPNSRTNPFQGPTTPPQAGESTRPALDNVRSPALLLTLRTLHLLPSASHLPVSQISRRCCSAADHPTSSPLPLTSRALPTCRRGATRPQSCTRSARGTFIAAATAANATTRSSTSSFVVAPTPGAALPTSSARTTTVLLPGPSWCDHARMNSREQARAATVVDLTTMFALSAVAARPHRPLA